MRRAQGVRDHCARLLCALALAMSAALAHGREVLVEPTSDATVAPEIDRLIAVARVGEHYEKLFALMFAEAPPESAGPAVLAEHELLRRVFSRVTWSRLQGPWRMALAQRMTPVQARAVLAYYDSEPGRAQIACFEAASTTRAVIACEDGIEGPHADAVSAHAASPEGRAFKRSMSDIVDLVMPAAVRDVLNEDPALAAEVAEMCRSRPGLLICTAQPQVPASVPAP